ncbi:hypothetical protein LUZ16_30020 [Streptomyces albireticuli]|nr:hypothetical protein [Streptomyces albireticuli]MCD9146188.1 hypothetical protein [Streptomyces albireticuli]
MHFESFLLSFLSIGIAVFIGVSLMKADVKDKEDGFMLVIFGVKDADSEGANFSEEGGYKGPMGGDFGWCKNEQETVRDLLRYTDQASKGSVGADISCGSKGDYTADDHVDWLETG